MLPFSADAFFALFAKYNHAIWPAQPISVLLALLVVGLALRPVVGTGRVIAGVLAAMWLWNAFAYHLAHFASLNFLAPAFAAAFALQALFLAWTGVVRGRLTYRAGPGPARTTGLVIAVFALVLYPLLGALAGHGWPNTPVIGVAPCPTTLLTLGLLLMADGRTRWHLLLIPVLWSLLGATAAWLLGVYEDLSLLAAAAATLGLSVWTDRRATAVQDLRERPR